ncbi:MAG: type II toxin-antitoxin system PemK/MazF family toxin [Selenomonas sp.]|nr:type II toxin-antitoxin system PemK/MazF family toxin [Selenomonas sp.]
MIEVEKRIVEAVELLKNFLQQLLKSKDSHQNKMAGLLAYWIKDYVRLMSKERSTTKYRRYKRGEVVKVHLGFRIGSEQGGLHYAVVVTTNDSVKSPVVTVVPLTSLKTADEVTHLPFGSVFLGAQLLSKLQEKARGKDDMLLAKEIKRLKWGSVALTNQIVTISKLRIYDPVNSNSPLSGVRLDSEALDQIDAILKQILFKITT